VRLEWLSEGDVTDFDRLIVLGTVYDDVYRSEKFQLSQYGLGQLRLRVPDAVEYSVDIVDAALVPGRCYVFVAD
jgi:hypothetical protein